VLDFEDSADTAFRRAVQDLDAHINAPRFLRCFIPFLAGDTFDGLAIAEVYGSTDVLFREVGSSS
jgi:hypothetical protein